MNVTRERLIKYLNDHYGKLLLGVLSISMVFVTVLLFVEYRFFAIQAEQMIALKEEYQAHLIAVNRVLQDYNKTKERLELTESMLEQKKKSNNVVSLAQAQGFPDGVRVFSSDDEICQNDGFVTINRELEYLKQSSLDYLKQHKLDLVLQRINNDSWRDYTDKLLERNQEKTSSKGGKRKRRRVASGRRKSVEKLSAAAKEAVRREKALHDDIEFNWPIKRSDFWLSSFFGPRRRANGAPGFHYGIDMAAVRGTPVRPAAGGIVVEARNAPGYGKTVVVAHSRKYRTRYAHLDKILVKPGQKVTSSDIIGRVGSTGYVRSKKGRDASHLHFEVYAFGKKVNPMYFFT
ncbi:MAG TPA: M23 family metallopeptidase [Candidatus Babeliales bacterium]|nr:M23 family metallopeptidase [Candidatus Babeliales bacterium]